MTSKEAHAAYMREYRKTHVYKRLPARYWRKGGAPRSPARAEAACHRHDAIQALKVTVGEREEMRLREEMARLRGPQLPGSSLASRWAISFGMAW